MRSRLPFARAVGGVSSFAVCGMAAFVLAALLCLAPTRAQDAPPGVIGRVEGSDVSVESGTAAGIGEPMSAPGISVVNGSVVTVHSGQARMTLAKGGYLDICGPSKFTVLQSGGAITLALSFGTVHAQLPASAVLRIFTPTIIATPLGIGDAARNVTVSLGLDTSLCVLADSGAIQLEQQFTGEKLVVPQAGEFSLASGKLAPVAGAAESCHCEVSEPSAPKPEEEPASKPVERASATPQPEISPAKNPQPLTTEPPAESSILAPANESHPIARSRQDTSPAAPSVSEQANNMVLPVLVFSASAPMPPDMGPDVILLARRARVEPEWDFDGHVAVPELASAVRQALGEGGSAPQSQIQQKKKGGFWAGFKRFFSGG
ncbi:MAG: hypothetical protein WA175_00050 [Candidatus Acidiferrales bacterium]